jgi:hypothetical protein
MRRCVFAYRLFAAELANVTLSLLSSLLCFDGQTWHSRHFRTLEDVVALSHHPYVSYLANPTWQFRHFQHLRRNIAGHFVCPQNILQLFSSWHISLSLLSQLGIPVTFLPTSTLVWQQLVRLDNGIASQ